MGGWIKHEATPHGRTIPSDTWIEARLQGQGFYRNQAGNFDNWRWRETGQGSIAAYRYLSRTEADALTDALARKRETEE